VNRKAFSRAAAQGLAVPELRQRDPKAENEILALFQHVFGTGIE